MRSLLLTMCVVLGMSATAQSLSTKNSYILNKMAESKSLSVVLDGKRVGRATQWYIEDSLVATKVVVFAELTDYQRESLNMQFEDAEIVFKRKARLQAMEKSNEYVDTDLSVQKAGELYAIADAVLYGSVATSVALVQSYAGNIQIATTIAVVGGVTSACLRMSGHFHLMKSGTKVPK